MYSRDYICKQARRTVTVWSPLLLYLALSVIFLWRPVFTSAVFLPAGLLGHISPYRAIIHSGSLPLWNPLRYDGIGQFYPWRLFAAQTLKSGYIPLWNPYQFCGTPFLANSQSAPLYPPNLMFLLVNPARAFAYSVIFHLTLCGWFTYLLLRILRVSIISAFLGGVIYAFSAWQVGWLQLPSFLDTSCWIPLLLCLLYMMYREKKVNSVHTAAAGVTLGLMLLAGHLQIAFYGLLAASLWALSLVISRYVHRTRSSALALLIAYLLTGAAGFMFEAPQLLPALELSRLSHRVNSPSIAGYESYTGYALQPQEITSLILPNFFGNDHNPSNRYWGFYTKILSGTEIALRHNSMETALYVSIPALMLLIAGVIRGFQRPFNYRVLFFALLALLAMLMAIGSLVDALFYFGIPGFGESGSPARVLALWALSLACLAAFGLDMILERSPRILELAAISAIPLLILGIGIGFVSNALSTPLPGFETLHAPTLSSALSRSADDWYGFCIFYVITIALLLKSQKFKPIALSSAFVILTSIDLFRTGMPVNPDSPPEWVYPATPGIRFLQKNAKHNRIFPINRFWSLDSSPPVILPPNGATVFRLHDLQGYDSLFTGQYKSFSDKFARSNQQGIRDSSPAEVGNMVFFENPNVKFINETGARYAAALPPDSSRSSFVTLPPATQAVYDAPGDMTIYPLPAGSDRAVFLPDSGTQIGGIPKFMQDDATRVTLSIDTPVPGLLILKDQNYPGWKATINRHAARIMKPPLQQGRLFKSVHLSSGKQIIQFKFQPFSFLIGLYLSCAALCSTIISLIIQFMHHKYNETV